ncbi:MAG: 2-isopropylmalate synthase [Candidatus Brocadiae bacterium]|nr:2-isopropylmalate synthase [Candidatus Brocadiia bacterium]
MTSPKPRESDLIYDWNLIDPTRERPAQSRHIELDDETLRDGLQNPSVVTPSRADKIRILHLMERLGIDALDIGLPGAGPKHLEDAIALAGEIVAHKMHISANCAGRTVEADAAAMVEVTQKSGLTVEAALFIGSSPIRQYAENWTLDMMLENTTRAVSFAVKHGLPVMYVTEDTTRAHPDTLRALYGAAIDCGATRICLCDTVGHATPDGVRRLVEFMKGVVERTGVKVKIDWHGHKDRGLDISNTMAAIEAGVNRVHGAALGIGERAGNTPMELILCNLFLYGYIRRDLTAIGEYCRAVSEACHVPIPNNYPLVGKDAFETGTGVHAAAVIKALRKGDPWLADRIYSGVPASQFGREQIIRVGPMSGRSNVIWWLEKRGIPVTDATVDRIFQAAKASDRMLEDVEVEKLAAAPAER